MEIIHRIPFIIGAFMALLFGIIGYFTNEANLVIYIKMAVGLVVFFIVGIFARNIVFDFMEINQKIKDEKRKKIEEEEALRALEEEESDEIRGKSLDYAIDDNNISSMRAGESIGRSLDNIR